LLEPAADGGYGVIFPEVPGCTSGGDTAEEAVRNAAEGLSGHLEFLLEEGDPIPEPAPLDAPLPAWLDEDLGEGEVPSERLVRVLVPAELPPRPRGT
jgi:predicted RNase H-like HicB family nuclease